MPKYSHEKELKQQKVVENPTPDKIKYINLRLRIGANAEYTGKVSGRQYLWHGAGSTLPVLEEDVPELLNKQLGRKFCCGNSSESNKIFEIAE